MIREKPPNHALLVRLGKYEFQAVGLPAILAVIALALLTARWLGLI